MKITLFILSIPALLIFCSAAHAQAAGGVMSNQPMILELPDHPETAAPHDMASERPLVGQGPNTYTYAQGERPLWEFGPVSEPVPLGDVARAYRQQKLVAKKATVVLEQQGSKETKTR
jgi:hypothetical protein